jgi:hypothetical protein
MGIEDEAMNEYSMQGADGSWYGPVDLDTLRDWAREERVVADTLVRVGDGEPMAAGALPELREAFPSEGVLDVRYVFKRSWRIFASHLGAVYGGCLLLLAVMILLEMIPKLIVLALSGVVPETEILVMGTGVIGLLFQMILTGPLIVGFYKYLLRLVDEGRADPSDLLEGFRLLWPSILLQWLKGALMIAMILVLLLPWAFLARNEVAGIQAGDPTWIVRSPITVVCFLVIALVVTIITTLWWLAEPMLADKAATTAWGALWQSTQRILGQIKPVVVYFTVASLLFLVALIPLGAGLLVAMPYLAVTSAQLYRAMVPKGSGDEA